MKKYGSPTGQALGTVGLAAVLWFLTFRMPFGNFWIKISASAAILALLALWLKRSDEMMGRFNFRTVLTGLISAAALYGIFLTGQTVSHLLFPFAGQQIEGIYSMGQGMPMWVIWLLLFFITGPAEEIFWRLNNLVPVIISHAFWSAFIFAVFPTT